MKLILTRVLDFFLNGFLAELDNSHWRKTVLLFFLVLGAFVWGQHQKVCAVEGEYVRKQAFDNHCTKAAQETKDMVARIERSVDALALEFREATRDNRKAIVDALMKAIEDKATQ